MSTLDHDGRPAIELHRALMAMGPDTGMAARCVIFTATGDLVGAVALSAADVERLRQAATAPEQDDFDDVDTSDAAQVIAAAEAVIIAAEMGGTTEPDAALPTAPAWRRPWSWLRRRRGDR